jgi:hypothetical protein
MNDNNNIHGVDRSALYNNAGVRLMTVGNHQAALELFRGALESKLTLERNALSSMEQPSNADDDDDSVTPEQRCVTPDQSDNSTSTTNVSSTASTTEHHPLNNLDSYLELSRTVGGPHSPQQSDRTTSTTDGVAAISIPNSNRGYEPYLFTTPFVVPERHNEDAPSVDASMLLTQSMSCKIVFNLGLIHQLVCRTSSKAASFYEIAATILSSLPDDTSDNVDVVQIRIALLNNFGVWCYENAEGESMMACFEQLIELFSSDATEFSTIDPSLLRGVQANFHAFLTPTNGVSLAA